MPRLFTRVCVALLLCCVLVPAIAGPASARRRRPVEPLELCPFEFGVMFSSFVGPSHENLLTRQNQIMPVMGSPDGFQFEDFGPITPVSLRMIWNLKYPLALSATYTYGQFFTRSDFEPHGWASDRSLTSDTHVIDVAFQYGLNFIQSRRVTPYVGLGLTCGIVDSTFDIDLVNVLDAGVEETGDEPYPDQYFQLQSTDFSIGATALAGLTYHISRRAGIIVEIAGMMNQVNQEFDFDGTWQYIFPPQAAEDPSLITDPGSNDIMIGNYPLKMNGIRVSMGLTIGI